MAHNSDEPASNCYSHFVSGHHAQVHELEKQVKAVEQFNQSTDALQNDCENKGRGKTPTGSKKPLSASEEMQKEARRHFYQILTEITQRKCAWMFMAPVDVESLELYGYHEIIEKPMDLGTVKRKMMAKDKSGYKNVREMYEDVKLTFKNAIKFNDKGSDVHDAAKTLLDKLETKWQDLLPKVEKAESQLLNEERHKRLYKMLVPEATYANMARGLSTESRKRGSSSTTETVPKRTKQNIVISIDGHMEDIGVTKKTSTSMGTSDTNATSQVDPKADGSHVEKEAEKKRKKKEVLSTEPSNTQAEKKKAKKKKNKESKSPNASIHKDEAKSQENPPLSNVADSSTKKIPEEAIEDSNQQQQTNPTKQRDPPVLETSDLPNKEVHVETEGDQDQNAGPKNSVDNLQDHVKDSETSPQVEKDKGTDSTEHIDVEEFFDSDTDSSARTGGSSLTPESSTSKVSAAAGIPPRLLASLNATSPEDALVKLVAILSSNSNTQDQSASFEQVVFSKAGQEAMEQRFKQDFIKDDIFEVVEKDPNSVFALKAFLGRLQNPRTHEGLLFLVTQAESHLEQFGRDFKKRTNNQQTLEAQIKAHSASWLQANNCSKSVEDMKRESKDALEVVASCDVNIAKWKAKIAAEEIRKEKFAKEATKVPKEEIRAATVEGLKCCNSARIIDAEIKHLTAENSVLDKKLAQEKELYYAFRRAAANSI
ncbi:transcription factor GTE1 [Trifolium repens]|nr:transcription factor GTE1 [Trifolium repens]